MANLGGRELTDYPYYLEKDWPIYSTKNKHQKAGSIKLNTMRNPEMCGYMTGAEYIAMVKDMALELKEAYQVAMEVLGTEPSERMGTEEVIPLSHGEPTSHQNSGSFVSENPAPAQPSGERKEMSEKQWDYIMHLCGRDTKMMNYVMEEYARLGLNFAGKDKPTSFQASKIIETLKDMKGEK
jgi:hypothetical protein